IQGFTEIIQAFGNEKLEKIKLRNNADDSERVVETDTVFIFIGTKPFTSWLPSSVIKNDKDFIVTGRDLFHFENYKNLWNLKREPYMLETSVPGIFAVGDVRANAMNRVASATGEGAMGISFTHR